LVMFATQANPSSHRDWLRCEPVSR
jgi:hypothetical protein